MDTILGQVAPGGSIMRTQNPNLFFRIASDGKTFTQSAVVRTAAGERKQQSGSMDIVIGSGRKGQTYLRWDGDALCQLPVSYWAEHQQWVNSPGFVDGSARFDRPITGRCLECHATSVQSQPGAINRYERASLVLGLSCEKCHGPGGDHVERHRNGSKPDAPSGIVNPAKLPRDRQIDVCALCHAGEGRSITAPGSFKPGDVLSQHIKFSPQAGNAPVDVHASQVQLLQRSRCYQETPAMTCATCHNVHQPQRNLAGMASRCLQCHKVDDCGKFPAMGHRIATDCVSCHMPLEQTSQIVISAQGGGTLQPKVRNHRIAVYPEARP